jgi:hypothetical protein
MSIFKRAIEFLKRLFVKNQPLPIPEAPAEPPASEAGPVTREFITGIYLNLCHNMRGGVTPYKKIRETAGKNRSREIDALILQQGGSLGEPYCVYGQQQAIDDICSTLKLDRKEIEIPEGGSTQRVFKKTPDKFKKQKPAPMRIVVWQNKSDATHGHFGMCLSEADSNGVFQTFEFNTSPDVSSVVRDGQGAHFLNRNIAGTHSMRVLGYIDLFESIIDATSRS